MQHGDWLETLKRAPRVVFGSDDDDRHAQLAELVGEPLAGSLSRVARHHRQGPAARKGPCDVHDHSSAAADQMIREADHRALWQFDVNRRRRRSGEA